LCGSFFNEFGFDGFGFIGGATVNLINLRLR
jgi:hypothetical protein